MKLALLAWLQFLVGLVILAATDYASRRYYGWLGGPGHPMPDFVWFGIPIMLGITGAAFLWRATRAIQRLSVRMVVVAVQVGLGFVIYLAACLWYVVDTGIDSL